ncbi:MAG: hypothetical protein JRI53_09800 [Deltaproteobacteria bacterium]|nr:hypothetical protein [Deltaproteobacteria bacterium]MBW2178779.1 hypothetical protein [Deltaproteobacteria bacterium]MBW2363490.1 hypothetical protein [Deltaproteobacteria bacterium]
MNRRIFLKKLGVLAGLALVAPKALLAAPKPVIAGGVITGPGKVRFNNKDYGVVAVNNKLAAKVWSKSFYKEAKSNSYFDAIMGKDKKHLIRVI